MRSGDMPRSERSGLWFSLLPRVLLALLVGGMVTGSSSAAGPRLAHGAPAQPARAWQLVEVVATLGKPRQPPREASLAVTARSVSENGGWSIPSGGSASMTVAAVFDIPDRVVQGEAAIFGAGGSAMAATSGVRPQIYPFADFGVSNPTCPVRPLESERGLGNRSHSFSRPVEGCPRDTRSLPDRWTWVGGAGVTVYGGLDQDGAEGVAVSVTAHYHLCPDPASCGIEPDLVADRLEVTQAVQDLSNSVRLVAHKRTYVRFHVHARERDYLTTARLQVRGPAGSFSLAPDNEGGRILVRQAPDRGVYQQAFTFLLPYAFTEGNVSLTAEVNPSREGRRDPTEADTANNTASAQASFEPVARLNLVLYRVGYKFEGAQYWTPAQDLRALEDWVGRAFPVSDLWVRHRDYDLGKGELNCNNLNGWLTTKRLWDLASNWQNEVPADTHYYGMVTDSGDFMQGCAKDSPGFVASGASGLPGNPNSPTQTSGGWDTDSTYGDWYGGHELAHTYGRAHAAYCGARVVVDDPGDPLPPGYRPYPHKDGQISPVQRGDRALYGFDVDTFAIYPPSWQDLMTYCPRQWMSDFLTHGLMDTFQGLSPSVFGEPTQARVDRLRVSGTLDPATGLARLDPMWVIPAAPELVPLSPGPYAIVQRDAAGRELARDPFQPRHSQPGPGPAQPAQGGDAGPLVLDALVPFAAGASRVDVEGPGGALAGSRSAGPGLPTVAVTAPAAGAVLTGDEIEVAWTAADPDGDPLTFAVQYSPDDGASWELLAQGLGGDGVHLPGPDVVASRGATGRFRVWASDGIHTASASSAAVTVPNRPPTVRIRQPAGGETLPAGQALALDGEATDLDDGSLGADAVSWTSDRDGRLGPGPRLAVAGLSAGLHTLSLRAVDAAGAEASDSVTVTVLAAGQMPPPPADRLLVGPLLARLEAGRTLVVYVDNAAVDHPIAWQVSADVPWLHADTSAGLTPARLTLTADPAPSGMARSARLVVTSPDLPGQEAVVHVDLPVPTLTGVFLPLIAQVAQLRLLPPPPTARPSASPSASATARPTHPASPTPTLDTVATRVAGTLTALAPTASPSATGTATPDAFQTAVAATLTALAPSPSPTATKVPTPGPSPTASSEITVVSAFTLAGDNREQSAFVVLDSLQLGLEIRNNTGQAADVALAYGVRDPNGDPVGPLGWQGTVAIDPTKPYWTLARQLPTDLPAGRYVFSGTATYRGRVQSAEAVFYLADELVAADDFADPASGWPTAASDPGAATIGYLGGTYQLLVLLADQLTWAAHPRRLGSLALEVDAWQAAGSGETGLVFGLADDGQTYDAFSLDRSGRFRLRRHSPAGWTTLRDWSAAPGARSGDGMNHLLVVRQPARLSVLVNGQELTTLRDLPAPEGRVGLFTGTFAQPGADGRFDNFRSYTMP
jgi:hypothetical protein